MSEVLLSLVIDAPITLSLIEEQPISIVPVPSEDNIVLTLTLEAPIPLSLTEGQPIFITPGLTSEPYFLSSEAYLFETGDKAKLDSALQEETDPIFNLWLSTTPPAYPEDITAETDPVVGAIDGIVKANGNGVISEAVAMDDYMLPFNIYGTPIWLENHAYAVGDTFSALQEGGSTGYFIVHTLFTSDATYDLTGKETANCYAYYIQPADIPIDPDEKVKFNSDDPTAGYLADKIIAGSGISVTEGTEANENKLVIANTDKGSDVVVPSIAGLLDETAHDQLNHSGLTGILALGTTSSTALAGDTVIPSIAGLLDETAHDQLNHTGLTGIIAIGTGATDAMAGNTTIPSIAGLLDETAHDQLDHSGLTGILALGITSSTALAGDTVIPSIAGLLDETTHDGLDHTGLTGVLALGTTSSTALAGDTAIPSALSELSDDTTHRLVTDTEKSTWNGKADTSAIPTKATASEVNTGTDDAKFITSAALYDSYYNYNRLLALSISL
jgi:hypothetical protein